MMKNNKWLKELLEIVAAFVAAWVFYQLLALAAHTSTPIVSVASLSMFHPLYPQHFDEWWNQKHAYYESIGIVKEEFMKFSVKNGLDKGDILFIVRDEKLEIGDIIIYHPEPGCFPITETIVHRIIKIENGIYTTKGDSNPAQDGCTVQMSQIEGKAVLAVPLFGYPRLWLEEILVRLR